MSDICRNCGEELKEGAKFCGSCGAKVEPAAAPAEPAVSEQPAYTVPEPNTAPENAAPPTDGYQPPQPEYYSAGQPAPPPYYAPNSAPPQGQYGQPPYGAPAPGQYGQPPYGAPGYGMQPQPKKKSKAGIIIGIIVVVIVAIIAVVIVVSKNAYEKTFNNGASNGSEDSTSAQTDSDAKPVSDKGFDTPEDAIAAYINGIEALVKGESTFADIMYNCYEYQYAEPAYKSTIEDTIDEQEGTVGSSFEMLSAYADDFAVSYKDFESKALTADEQEKFIEDNMIETYCDTENIEEVSSCSFTMVMSFAGIDSDNEMSLCCIKADGRWFLSFSSMEE